MSVELVFALWVSSLLVIALLACGRDAVVDAPVSMGPVVFDTELIRKSNVSGQATAPGEAGKA